MTSASSPCFGHSFLSHWGFDPGLLYLNHGTVGAPPRDVLKVQQQIRDEIEREPARFQLRELADTGQRPLRGEPRMRVAARAVAQFVKADPADLVFVDNATTGVNAVLRSLTFAPGDEVVVTDHTYGAVVKGTTYITGRAGASVRSVELPGPPWTSAGIADAIDGACTPKTRLILIDHISSGTALIWPVAEIARRARARGIAVLVDGAHAPGAIPLDIPALGVDWYVANLHKWAMAPRSSAFLWAARDRHADLHPTVISWGYGLGIASEFDLIGTRDPTPWLAAPAGIDFLHTLGFDALRQWNHDIAWNGARMLTSHWGVPMTADESMIGTMASVQLPSSFPADAASVQQLRDELLYDDRIEVQMNAFKNRAWVRFCGQAYIEPSDLDRLRDAIDRRLKR